MPPQTGLCLSRRDGEQIIITIPDGRTVTITVHGKHRGKTHLHFAAERDIAIDRKEVRDFKLAG